MSDSLWLHGIHGLLQVRILEWVAFPFSKWSSQPRDRTQVSCMAGRVFTIWATAPPLGLCKLPFAKPIRQRLRVAPVEGAGGRLEEVEGKRTRPFCLGLAASQNFRRCCCFSTRHGRFIPTAASDSSSQRFWCPRRQPHGRPPTPLQRPGPASSSASASQPFHPLFLAFPPQGLTTSALFISVIP